MPDALPSSLDEALVETIAAAVTLQLSTVTEGNGYLVSLVRPRRPKGRVQQIADFEAIIEQTQMGRQEAEESIVDNAWAVRFDVSVFYNVPLEPSDGDDDDALSIDTILNRIWASVAVAVQADPKWGLPTFVLDTEYGDPEFLGTPDGALACCNFPFIIRYEHKRGDPTRPII